jgi:hypothetical protein
MLTTNSNVVALFLDQLLAKSKAYPIISLFDAGEQIATLWLLSRHRAVLNGSLTRRCISVLF